MVGLLCWGSESTAPAKDWREQSCGRHSQGQGQVPVQRAVVGGRSIPGDEVAVLQKRAKSGPRGHRRQRSFFSTRRLPTDRLRDPGPQAR